MVHRSLSTANRGVHDNQFVHLSGMCNGKPYLISFNLLPTHSVTGGCKRAIHICIMHVHV